MPDVISNGGCLLLSYPARTGRLKSLFVRAGTHRGRALLWLHDKTAIPKLKKVRVELYLKADLPEPIFTSLNIYSILTHTQRMEVYFLLSYV